MSNKPTSRSDDTPVTNKKGRVSAVVKGGVIVLAAALLGCVLGGSKDSVSAHGDEVHTAEFSLYADMYEPMDIEIEAGTIVTFTNKDTSGGLHWPASDIHPTHAILSEFDPGRGLEQGESWSYTFERTGTWRYHDHLVPDIVGRITVIAGEGSNSAVEDSEARSNVCLCFIKDLLGMDGDEDAGLQQALADGPQYQSIEVTDESRILNDIDGIGSYVTTFGLEKTGAKLLRESGSHDGCHSSAHIAGRIAFSNDGNAVFSSHVPECLSGMIHGATEGFFATYGTENINENVAIVCPNELNSFYGHQCNHGIGHGLMSWAAYDIHEALDLCSSLDSGQASCYSGVYMENVVGGLSGLTGHTTDYLSDDPHMPCNVVNEEYVYGCYAYQSSRMTQLLQNDFSAVAKECFAAGEHANQFACFTSMGRDIHAVNQYTLPNIEQQCLHAVDTTNMLDFVDDCVNGAVQMTVWSYEEIQSEAVALCAVLTTKDRKDRCNNVLISNVSLVATDEQVAEFCTSVIADAYRESCMVANDT